MACCQPEVRNEEGTSLTIAHTKHQKGTKSRYIAAALKVPLQGRELPMTLKILINRRNWLAPVSFGRQHVKIHRFTKDTIINLSSKSNNQIPYIYTEVYLQVYLHTICAIMCLLFATLPFPELS